MVDITLFGSPRSGSLCLNCCHLFQLWIELNVNWIVLRVLCSWRSLNTHDVSTEGQMNGNSFVRFQDVNCAINHSMTLQNYQPSGLRFISPFDSSRWTSDDISVVVLVTSFLFIVCGFLAVSCSHSIFWWWTLKDSPEHSLHHQPTIPFSLLVRFLPLSLNFNNNFI